MTISSAMREREFLQILASGYEAEGFSVFLHPVREMLPPFMHGYRPDAIAIRNSTKIAIEIKGRATGHSTRTEQLENIFSKHPDWELRIYYIPDRADDSHFQPPSLAELDAALAEVEQLKRDRHSRAALLMAWAALEAASRALVPERLGRAQTPDRLIEMLASEGIITPAEADRLRKVYSLRNAAAHGDFAAPITEAEIDDVVAAARLVRTMASEQAEQAEQCEAHPPRSLT
jgi:hypothetical protein